MFRLYPALAETYYMFLKTGVQKEFTFSQKGSHMESYGVYNEPRKSNFWKWTCGCGIVFIVVSIVLCVVLWYALSHWDKGQSAWDHMPPSTFCAMEVYDVKGLLASGFDDPGVRSILQKFSTQMEEAMAEASGEQKYAYRNFVNDLSETFSAFSPFFTMAIPNLGTIGLSQGEDEDSHEVFIIFRPPAWLRMGMTSGEDIEHSTNDEGMDLYIFNTEGWMIVATSEELANEIKDNWNNKSLPLGPSPLRDGPYFAIAMKGWAEDSEGEEDEDTGQPAPVVLKNPFGFSENGDVDADGDTEVVEGAEDAGFGLRLVVFTDAKGWVMEGEGVRRRAVGSGAISEEVAKLVPAARLAAKPGFGSDVEIIVNASPEVAGRHKENFNRKYNGALPGIPAKYQELAWRWLNDAWLDKADGAAAMYARQAVAGTVDGVPPLPVVSVSWRLDAEVDPDEAAAEFGDSLAALLAALREDDASSASQAVLQSIEYSREDGPTGYGGVADIPPVMANSARPAWFFPKMAAPGLAWAASDPAGIDKTAGAAGPDWGRLGEVGENSLKASGVWDVSTDFREDLFEVIMDRWENIADTDGDDEKSRFKSHLETLRHFLSAFPRGEFDSALDPDEERVLFRVKVPTGVKVAW